MENELSTFNVIHWESKLNDIKETTRLNFQLGTTGGWINNIAIMQFRWRIMDNEENPALHFVAENNITIPKLESFNESKMNTLLTNSLEKVNNEIKARTKENGNLILQFNFTNEIITKYYNEFLQALKVQN